MQTISNESIELQNQHIDFIVNTLLKSADKSLVKATTRRACNIYGAEIRITVDAVGDKYSEGIAVLAEIEGYCEENGLPILIFNVAGHHRAFLMLLSPKGL